MVLYLGGRSIQFQKSLSDPRQDIVSRAGLFDTEVTNFGNGIERRKKFDTDHRITSIVAEPVQNLTYEYKPSSFDLSLISDLKYTGQSSNYDYDDNGRLTYAKTGNDIEEFDYDAAGNRISRTINGRVDIYNLSSNSSRLDTILGGITRFYFHDSGGNVILRSGGTKPFQAVYDHFGRLLVIKDTKTGVKGSFSYNALHQRVHKKGTNSNGSWAFGTIFLYDLQGRLVAEIDDRTGAIASIYVYLENELVAGIRNADVNYILTDHLGRPEIATNQSKQITWRAKNKPFDRAIAVSTTYQLNIGFPGQYHDAEFGLWYNWNRYYDSEAGRYLQPDPIESDVVRNSYAYAQNNPVLFVDPDGQTSVVAYLLPFFRIGGEAMGVTRATGLAGMMGGPGMIALEEILGAQQCSVAGGEAGASVAAAGSPGDPDDDNEPEGGVYTLTDSRTGEVVRTGRTKDLIRRRSEHARNPLLGSYDFRVVYRTNSYEAQRGLEQILHKAHNPRYNFLSPISRINPRIDDYMRAAESFLNGIR